MKTFLVAALAAAVALVLLTGCSGTRPRFVGEGNGKFAPCPATPNCISTLATDSEHKMDPLTYEGSPREAMNKLIDVVRSMKRTSIIARTEDYLYVEYTSAFWRFVDDVEFSFDSDGKTIQFRSSSRLGKRDLGVNRKRMEEVKARFDAPRK